MTTQTLNEEKLHTFMGKMLTDFGGAATAPLVMLGDELGLFRTLAGNTMTPSQLATATGTGERYIREWLAAMAASGYVEYDEATETFSMSPEQMAVFTDPTSPYLMTGGYFSLASVFADVPKLSEAFRSGEGIRWGDHDSCLFCGVERFFRPSYETFLIDQWLPALDGVVEKLQRGIRVADVGCGHGASTLIMAAAFPNSTFVGYDIHDKSIQHARNHAAEQGLTNVSFAEAAAKTIPGGFDLVTTFDCLHDMGDPRGAAARIYESLNDGGTWMMVEPMAGDTLTDNMNPIGRIYYAFSTTVCVPTSLSQEVGEGLGAQAGEKRLFDVVGSGGFTTMRRAAETPFNLILEARK